MINKLIKIKYWILEIIYHKRSLAIISWIPSYNLWKIKKNNWGDDVSLGLVKLISNFNVIPAQFQFSATKKVNYSIIGSLIPWYIYDTTIVWGSGIKSPEIPFIRKPIKVYAVRGPLSRKVLLENDIDCPEIYGDPALLFPLLYTPTKKNNYEVGIILHHSDLEDPYALDLVQSLSEKYNVLLINIKQYGKWQNFIDEVYSCTFIISSSLHGLIIADAYGIPNMWGKFSYEFGLGRYKFHDYFLSVNKEIVDPIPIDNNVDITSLMENSMSKLKAHIDILPLINSCPFENNLNQKYIEFMKSNFNNTIYTKSK